MTTTLISTRSVDPNPFVIRWTDSPDAVLAKGGMQLLAACVGLNLAKPLLPSGGSSSAPARAKPAARRLARRRPTPIVPRRPAGRPVLIASTRPAAQPATISSARPAGRPPTISATRTAPQANAPVQHIRCKLGPWEVRVSLKQV